MHGELLQIVAFIGPIKKSLRLFGWDGLRSCRDLILAFDKAPYTETIELSCCVGFCQDKYLPSYMHPLKLLSRSKNYQGSHVTENTCRVVQMVYSSHQNKNVMFR